MLTRTIMQRWAVAKQNGRHHGYRNIIKTRYIETAFHIKMSIAHYNQILRSVIRISRTEIRFVWMSVKLEFYPSFAWALKSRSCLILSFSTTLNALLVHSVLFALNNVVNRCRDTHTLNSNRRIFYVRVNGAGGANVFTRQLLPLGPFLYISPISVVETNKVMFIPFGKLR